MAQPAACLSHRSRPDSEERRGGIHHRRRIGQLGTQLAPEEPDAPNPRDSFVYIRGERNQRGPIAPRQFLEIFAGKDQKPYRDGSGRLDLAKAIADAKNPLTARVMVNRIWHYHFGRGIVAHIAFADPVCEELRRVLLKSAKSVKARVHDGGSYVNMEGPAFSTRAESRTHHDLGYAVIGMTNLGEARCAREANLGAIRYRSVRDPAHGACTALLLPELGLLPATDPRFLKTLERVEKELATGDLLFRYRHADDFGEPENAFTICAFWYVNALAATGRIDEARERFSRLLERRNPLGLLSEDISPVTGELWGNFPQTYSMVGLISSAIRLSQRWDQAF